MITLQTGKPVNIALPHVYRYMDKKYIDMFFNEGILRISSFQKFIHYPDEIRGDKSEGSGSYLAKANDGFQFHVMTSVGNDAYLFCTSLMPSEDIANDFEVDSYFKITKPVEFSAAVLNAIPGSTQAFLGFCNYQEHRIVQKQVEGLSINDFTNEEGHLIIGGAKMNQRTDEIMGNGIDIMFLKENKYQTQSEFRFVWIINSSFFEMHEYLDIKCKEAIQFCERIDSTT